MLRRVRCTHWSSNNDRQSAVIRKSGGAFTISENFSREECLVTKSFDVVDESKIS